MMFEPKRWFWMYVGIIGVLVVLFAIDAKAATAPAGNFGTKWAAYYNKISSNTTKIKDIACVKIISTKVPTYYVCNITGKLKSKYVCAEVAVKPDYTLLASKPAACLKRTNPALVS